MAIKPPQTPVPSMFTGPGPEDPPPPPGWGYPSGTPSGMNCWREVDILLKYRCQKPKPPMGPPHSGFGPAPPRPASARGNIIKIEGFCMVECICQPSMNLPEDPLVGPIPPHPESFGRWYINIKPECGENGWRWVNVKQRTNMGPCTDTDDDGTYDDCMGGSGIFIDEEVELPFNAGDVIPGMGAGGGSTGNEADHCGAGIAVLGYGGRRNTSKPISQEVADCMNKKFCSCKKRGAADIAGGMLWPGAGSAGGVNNMQNEQMEKILDKLLRKRITDEDCRPGGTGSA